MEGETQTRKIALMKANDIDTNIYKNIECPHCSNVQREALHLDGFDEETWETAVLCPKCDKIFKVRLKGIEIAK